MAQVTITGGTIEAAIHNEMKYKTETRTLSGNITLENDSPTMQFIDPNGARTLTLPAEADSAGLMFFISNEAGGAEVITIQNDAAATIVTPTQNEAAIVFCDGVTWSGMVGSTA